MPEKISQMPRPSNEAERAMSIPNYNAKMSILQYARRYYEKGFTPLPLKPTAKEPAVAWRHWEYRRPEWDEIEQAFNYVITVFGSCNIGLICGQAHNLAVLDIDSPEKFEVAKDVLGFKIPTTPFVKTPKGFHVYFRYPEGYKLERVERLNDWGCELRGNKCIIVAPPSIVNEHEYMFLTKNGQLCSPFTTNLQEIPFEILEAFGLPKEDQQNSSISHIQLHHQNNGQLPEWGRSFVDLLKPHWKEGKRHDLSLALAGLFAKACIPYEILLNILKTIAEETGDKELPDRLRAIKDTYDKTAFGQEVVGWSRLETLLDDEVLQKLRELLPSSAKKDGRKPAPLLQWRKVMALQFHELTREFLVDGLIPKSGLVCINGRPKVGKSIFTANLAKSLLEGTPFLGRLTKQSIVIYLDFERRQETNYRLTQLGVDGNERLFSSLNYIGADALEELELAIQDLRLQYPKTPVVLIIDSYHDFIRPLLRQRKASINDYTVISETMQEQREFAERTGVTIILTHHQRKATNEEISEIDILGSTAVAGKLDLIIHLIRDRTNSDVIRLVAEGNVVAKKQSLCFTINEDFSICLADEPTKTQEEQARRIILLELLQAGDDGVNGVKRKDLIDAVKEKLQKETNAGAENVTERALRELSSRGLVETLVRGVYRLTEQGYTEASRLYQSSHEASKHHPIAFDANDASQRKHQKHQKHHDANDASQVESSISIKPYRDDASLDDVDEYPFPNELKERPDRCVDCGDILEWDGDEGICLACGAKWRWKGGELILVSNTFAENFSSENFQR